MAYVWLGYTRDEQCGTCYGEKVVGTGRNGKWGEEIKKTCGTCNGAGIVKVDVRERVWRDDPPEEK